MNPFRPFFLYIIFFIFLFTSSIYASEDAAKSEEGKIDIGGMIMGALWKRREETKATVSSIST